jgi:hypothetical protein
MIGKLEYSLPEEQEEFELACKAGQMSGQLDDIKTEIRKIRKYTEFKNKEVEKAMLDFCDLLDDIIYDI